MTPTGSGPEGAAGRGGWVNVNEQIINIRTVASRVTKAQWAECGVKSNAQAD